MLDDRKYFWDEMQLVGLVMAVIGVAANHAPFCIFGVCITAVATYFMLTDGRLGK